MTYMGSGDPARRRNDYHSVWLENLADDVTMEAAAMAASRRAEDVRSIVGYARELYDYQDFNYAGPYGDNGFLEDWGH